MATGMIKRGSGSAYTRLIRRDRARAQKARGEEMTKAQEIADIIIGEMFAPHELPLDDKLAGLYLAIANKVLAALPQSPLQRGKLTRDQIMEIIRHVTGGELRKMLTYKCWKDGIEIDQPTFAAEQLAEQFRAALADTRPLREGK